MKSLDREALILDRAIDLMLAGGEVVDDPRVHEASRLFAAIEAMPSAPARERVNWRMFAPVPVRKDRWIRWVAAVPAVAVLAVGGVAFAARNAKPGDALYGIHRVEEASRIALVAGRLDHAKARLDRASGDITEARELLGAKRVSDARDALENFKDDLSAARREIAALPEADAIDLSARADALAADADTLEAQINSAGLGEGEGSGLSDDRGMQGRGTTEVERHGEEGTSSDDSGGTSTSGSGETSTSGSGDDSHGGTSGETQASPTPTASSDDGHGGDSSPSPTASPTSNDGSSGGESPH